MLELDTLYELGEYAHKHTTRVHADAVEPGDVDLHFFRARPAGADREVFQRLPAPLVARLREGEVSYLELGGAVGDQGVAFCVMGLGEALGQWLVNTPERMLGELVSQEVKDQLAGVGYITIALTREEEQ